MKKIDIELGIGLFIFVGLLLMVYTSVNLGQVEFFRSDRYPIETVFTSVKGLKKDTDVEIAGVKVGTVKDIQLDGYKAAVTMMIDNGIEIQDDAIASIRTRGVLGEKYIEILPGGSDVILQPGDFLFDTEPPLDLELLIKNFVIQGKNP